MGGGGDCGKAWAPARGPGREDLSFLSFPMPFQFLVWDTLLFILSHYAQPMFVELGSTWVGREVGPQILGSDSGPAQPTDYKRILASGPPGSSP